MILIDNIPIEFDEVQMKGNLKWEGGVKDSKVVFEPDPDGKWRLSKYPENNIKLNQK